MYRLRMLGGWSLLTADGSPVPRLRTRRTEAALAVLALSGELGCTRERLVALLWPESDEARSRQGLRDALHSIRRVLGRDTVTGSHLLRLDAALVESDVQTFWQAKAARRLVECVDTYTGPLLNGFHVDNAPEFERWLDDERSRLVREHADALKQLAQQAATSGRPADVVSWWARAVETDPLNSHIVLRYAEALLEMGDRASAVRAVDAHVKRVRSELELEPGAEVLMAVERLRTQEATARVAAPRAPVFSVVNPAMHPAAVSSESRVPVVSHVERRRRGWRRAVQMIAAGTVLALIAVLVPKSRRQLEPSRPHTTIAVLPFRTIGIDSTDAQLAAGLHEELLTQLAGVGSLTVIGGTSMRGYHESPKPLRQIAAEVRAGSVVEATIQLEGTRLRVVVRLLDPVTDAILWADTYDRTLDDAFVVQSDIAQRIVASVGVTLTGAESATMVTAPTNSARAYQLYLQGVDYERRPGIRPENFVSALGLFDQAVALDSGFALAHARLGKLHFAMWDLGYDRTSTRLQLARREADAARRLAPDLPQARLAVGLAHHVTRGAYREALQEFEMALRFTPGEAETWAWIARVQRRRGSWDSAVVAFTEAQRLNPRDDGLFMSFGNTLHALRRYPEAIEMYRQAASLGPDVAQSRLSLAWSYVLWKGELDTLRAVLQSLPLDADPGGNGGRIGIERVLLLMMERKADSVLAILRSMSRAGTDPRTLSVRSGTAHLLRGDSAAARTAFDSAVVYYDSVTRAHPDDEDVHTGLGIALSALGKRAGAEREARWLQRHAPASGLPRALILTRLGKSDSALAIIESMLSQPSALSVPYLRLDPHWNEIVRNPKGEALLARYSGSQR